MCNYVPFEAWIGTIQVKELRAKEDVSNNQFAIGCVFVFVSFGCVSIEEDT